MPHLMRNDLTITGYDIKPVLEFIGFDPLTPVHHWGNQRVLFDFTRIIPEPTEEPPEGRRKWRYSRWGTAELHYGYLPGDIFELSSTRVSFAFYTEWASAFTTVEFIATQFPDFRFWYRDWELTNHQMAETLWVGGQQVVYTPTYDMKLLEEHDAPAMDPVTPYVMAKAQSLLDQLRDGYQGLVSPDPEALEVVARTIAISGCSVELGFDPDATDLPCLRVEAGDPLMSDW
jgi:hypothetical protein